MVEAPLDKGALVAEEGGPMPGGGPDLACSGRAHALAAGAFPLLVGAATTAAAVAAVSDLIEFTIRKDKGWNPNNEC
jgi:hypothetical protein